MQCTLLGRIPCTSSSSSCLPRLASSFSISYALSKWSSIARLWRPVMKIISVRPAATAPSTASWMSGLSTTGIISFGLALVAGRNRLPKPATGNTALVIARMTPSPFQQLQQAGLIEDRDPERFGLRELRTRIGPRDHVIGLLRHRAGDLAAARFDELRRLVARHARQRPGQHERLARGASAGGGATPPLLPPDPGLAERLNNLAIVPFREELADRRRNDRPHVGHLPQRVFVRVHEGFQRAEVTGQITGGGLADVADPEPIDEPCKRRVLRLLERVEQILGRLLAHALEARQGVQGELVQIRRGAHEVRLDELVDDLLAETVDVERAARREVKRSEERRVGKEG